MNRINEYENNLRLIITDILGSGDNSDYKVSDKRIQNWKEKREIERKKYKDILVENRLIYFSDFYDIKTIIHKNWEKFTRILGDKKRFEVFFDEIEKYRNTLAHGRTLTTSQENLLNGIIADLKNAITIYRNKNEMKEDYFIRIIKVSDNLGNSWPAKISERAKPQLRVGNEYELIVEANDPKDRIIKYSLSSNKGNIIEEQDSNRLIFTVQNKHIGEKVALIVRAFTPDSEYQNIAAQVIRTTILPN
ncbi:Swt1 family HEPN domain-containing protein [Salegentibacter mishustinae]|uniref:Swt1 family HEPN domain-containing protein n=1 Tax=Salegentibacter mishustinae TaxID=270918 RepID=UPI002490B41C|nr:Swt1 family HEPN domain-containing protein [Salegentibacter mishustinae]